MLYLCYDTALNEEYTLIQLLQKYPASISLFKGTDDEDIWDAAPYLFEVADNFYGLRKDGLVQLDHCIVFEANEIMEEVCKFLQYYMYKKMGDKILYNRIWDARIFVSQLPGWEEKERLKFFEFFKAVYAEQNNKEWFDKWQLTRLNRPMATPVLIADVLPVSIATTHEASLQAPNRSTLQAPKNTSSSQEHEVPDATKQSPPRRRFL